MNKIFNQQNYRAAFKAFSLIAIFTFISGQFALTFWMNSFLEPLINALIANSHSGLEIAAIYAWYIAQACSLSYTLGILAGKALILILEKITKPILLALGEEFEPENEEAELAAIG